MEIDISRKTLSLGSFFKIFIFKELVAEVGLGKYLFTETT
jgi:hypothetical protein